MGVEIAEPRHPHLRRMLAYWDEKRGARPFPSRRDIDPVDFGYVLGSVSLVEVFQDPQRFRYRIAGSHLTGYLGYEMTGRFADEFPEREVGQYVTARYEAAILRRQPVIEAGDEILDGRLWRHETVYLPLSNDGATIDMLLVCRIAEPPRRIADIERKSGVA